MGRDAKQTKETESSTDEKTVYGQLRDDKKR